MQRLMFSRETELGNAVGYGEQMVFEEFFEDGALWISAGSGLEFKISDNEGSVPGKYRVWCGRWRAGQCLRTDGFRMGCIQEGDWRGTEGQAMKWFVVKEKDFVVYVSF